MLTRLIYCSVAAEKISVGDLVSICKKASVRNMENGITGALAFCDNYFLQALEGKRDAVWSTFSRIQQDERHHDVQLIGMMDVEDRAYPEWSMRFVELQRLPSEDVRALIEKHSGESKFTPWKMSGAQCDLFLQELYEATSDDASPAANQLEPAGQA